MDVFGFRYVVWVIVDYFFIKYSVSFLFQLFLEGREVVEMEQRFLGDECKDVEFLFFLFILFIVIDFLQICLMGVKVELYQEINGVFMRKG